MRLFPHYIWKNVRFYQVVIPFLYLPSILFYSGENLFFIVGKYSDFFLLRSRFVPFFMDSKNSKYSPLPHRFKRIFHGFLLASLFAFSLRFSLFALCSFFCSASVRWENQCQNHQKRGQYQGQFQSHQKKNQGHQDWTLSTLPRQLNCNFSPVPHLLKWYFIR